MNIRQRIANRIAGPNQHQSGLPATQRNSMGEELARDFLVNGSRFAELPDWSQTIMADRDKYTGYMYGAIVRRVNKVSWLAQHNLRTRANDDTASKAKAARQDIEHPYLTVIDNSPSFANDAFWREIQTYIDLHGAYYLMAIRGKAGSKVGEVTEFKLLNPYDITVVFDDQYNLIGYTEVRGDKYREIEPHMIIPIRTLNPFDRTKTWAMADAAQDTQFTLKEAAQHMRSTLRRNRKYPGVVLLGGNGVALNPQQVDNYKSRMRGKAVSSGSDEPMFATAESVKGGISWNDMQVDMGKSAVDVVNEIQLNALIAVSGTSKTKLGIEQSGVTRDTAGIQDDLFVEDHGMPALQLIIDALNQDYKNNYPDDYKNNGYQLFIDSPLKEDKDAELTDVTNRVNRFDLYLALLDKGYDQDTAAAYANGDKDLTEIGKPVEPSKPEPPVTPPADPVVQDPQVEKPISAKASFMRLVEERALTGKQFNQISARDYPDIYADLDIDFNDLGCIMLDFEPLDVLKFVDGGEDDLAAATDPDDHAMGAVAEHQAHTTLLFGLLENGNRWKDKVDRLLEDWNPGTVRIEQVGYFDTPDSYAIVAHIQKTPEVVDGHERLTLLPHINTFSEYRPHVTLAYIKKDADLASWIDALGKEYNGATLTARGINYGDPEDGESANSDHRHPEVLPVIRNQVDPTNDATTEQQTAALKTVVINVQHQIIMAVVNKVTQNAFDLERDIIDQPQRNAAESELDAALQTFYTAIIPLAAGTTMNRRATEFSLPGMFTMDKPVKDYIKLTASRAANSHMDTVLGDILDTVKATEERLVQGELKKIEPQPGQSPEDVLQLARKKALDGVGREQVAAAVRKEYGDTISKVRADTIARTETNRVYNRAQFEADRQFLAQNNLTGKAYKKWITRSDNPCQYCRAKAAEPPIPFTQAFAKVGDVLTATFEKQDGTTSVRSMTVGFEDCMAAEIHPNGHCKYQLIIED